MRRPLSGLTSPRPPGLSPLTVSYNLKRTSYWPFGRRFTLPATNALAPLAFHAPRSTESVSATGVEPASILVNLPLRCRSWRTIVLTCCGEFASLAKFAVAIGNWVDPTPVTRTLSCAWAAPPTAIRNDATSVSRPSLVLKLMLYGFPKNGFNNASRQQTDPKRTDSFPSTPRWAGRGVCCQLTVKLLDSTGRAQRNQEVGRCLAIDVLWHRIGTLDGPQCGVVPCGGAAAARNRCAQQGDRW